MIVVVGAGIAGLCAAFAAAGDSRLGSEGLATGGRASIPKNSTYRPQEVLLVCKDKFVESNTYHAQGGVATAIFNDDSPALHATDTMAAVSYTHLTLPTTHSVCRSRWSPYH